MPATRGYQQEMLEESLRSNIIIALDTGSGKTHIAVLRMKIEAERQPTKVRCSVNLDYMHEPLPRYHGLLRPLLRSASNNEA